MLKNPHQRQKKKNQEDPCTAACCIIYYPFYLSLWLPSQSLVKQKKQIKMEMDVNKIKLTMKRIWGYINTTEVSTGSK